MYCFRSEIKKMMLVMEVCERFATIDFYLVCTVNTCLNKLVFFLINSKQIFCFIEKKKFPIHLNSLLYKNSYSTAYNEQIHNTNNCETNFLISILLANQMPIYSIICTLYHKSCLSLYFLRNKIHLFTLSL
jgi:hypothetical protein